VNVAKRFGVGSYQYEVVDNWPSFEIGGVAADVALDSKGRAYVGVRNIPEGGGVANILPGIGQILVLNPDGSYLTDWGNTFSSPHGLWVNGDDELFVADTGLHTVTRHASAGEILQTLGTRGTPGTPGAPFNMPTRAKQAPNGDIFVSDGYGQNRVHRFSSAGEHILTWGGGDPVFIQKFRGEPVTGTVGTGPGEFNLPHDVTITGDSRVFVLDRENSRLQEFTIDGTFVGLQRRRAARQRHRDRPGRRVPHRLRRRSRDLVGGWIADRSLGREGRCAGPVRQRPARCLARP